MKKVVWLSDIHLNTIRFPEFFFQEVESHKPDVIIITGDICEANDLEYNLTLMKETLSCPIYFVLGNHDYYNSTIENVRQLVKKTCTKSNLSYMSLISFKSIGNIAIIGADGWYDAFYGNWVSSRYWLSDWDFIKDFYENGGNIKDIGGIVSLARKLANESVFHIEKGIKLAIRKGYKKVVIITHVPPFKDICLYQKQQSGDLSLPWFSSQLLGDMLLEIINTYPHILFELYCGHTHSYAYKKINNLQLFVSEASYGNPQINMLTW